jgi:hypothetical protein
MIIDTIQILKIREKPNPFATSSLNLALSSIFVANLGNHKFCNDIIIIDPMILNVT